MCTMDWLETSLDEPNCTIIIDDMSLEVDEDTVKKFSVGSHHYNANVIGEPQLCRQSPSKL